MSNDLLKSAIVLLAISVFIVTSSIFLDGITSLFLYPELRVIITIFIITKTIYIIIAIEIVSAYLSNTVNRRSNHEP